MNQRSYNRSHKFNYGQSKCSFISNQEDTSSYDELIPYKGFKGIKSTDDDEQRVFPNSNNFYNKKEK